MRICIGVDLGIHLMLLSSVTFTEYNISTTAAFSGASQQWVCMHQVNLSIDLKGSFCKFAIWNQLGLLVAGFVVCAFAANGVYQKISGQNVF